MNALSGEIWIGPLWLVDRKSWMGGRSRTLAPPRGAAWIVDRLSGNFPLGEGGFWAREMN